MVADSEPSARRAVLLADLAGRCRGRAPQHCQACAKPVEPRAAWLVVTWNEGREREVLLCDDCTEKWWDSTWVAASEAEEPPVRSPGLRLVE